LSVFITPLVTRTSPVISSNAKPSLKTSWKSSEIRRGNDCNDKTPRSLPIPGSIFVKRPLPVATANVPVSVG
jgi:hypothetical protein